MRPYHWNELFTGLGKLTLEKELLPRFLSHCRWFGGKNRSIASVHIEDLIPAPDESKWAILILGIDYIEGLSEVYCLPLAMASSDEFQVIQTQGPVPSLASWVIEESDQSLTVVLFEALYHPGFRAQLLQLVASGGFWPSVKGGLRGQPSAGAFVNFISTEATLSHVLKVEQSNSALIYPERYFFKIIRRLEKGENPELEILKFLKEKTSFRNAPSFEGALVYDSKAQTSISIGIVEGLVAHTKGAWEYSLEMATDFLDRHLAIPTGPMKMDSALAFSRLVGIRTAELHLALASGTPDSDFAPEPFSFEYQLALSKSMSVQANRVLSNLENEWEKLPSDGRNLAAQVLNSIPRVLDAYSGLCDHLIPTQRIRVHGDYHLGQVLYTGKDICILDFEGEPMRPLSERKQKLSAWKDVAGMLRSFHYAIHSARSQVKNGSDSNRQILDAATEAWHKAMTLEFLEAYLRAGAGAPFIPSQQDRKILLKAYLMEKAIYELDYEMNNRPDWTHIPMLGILNLL